jgi:RNA polymerase sigma-70 factor (ECF subfamily)
MADRIPAEAADAVEGLYLAEAPGLFGYALTLPGVGRQDAEDLVQMTFQAAAVAWERQLEALGEESRRKWLYCVLRNKAVDQWRSGAARTLSLESADNVPGPLRDICDQALNSVLLDRCWDRIARMPQARQRVAFLKWGEDWSTADIAAVLGITQATVRTHLKRARDELAEEVGPDVFFTEAGEEADARTAL